MKTIMTAWLICIMLTRTTSRSKSHIQNQEVMFLKNMKMILVNIPATAEAAPTPEQWSMRASTEPTQMNITTIFKMIMGNICSLRPFQTKIFQLLSLRSRMTLSCRKPYLTIKKDIPMYQNIWRFGIKFHKSHRQEMKQLLKYQRKRLKLRLSEVNRQFKMLQ